MAWYDKYTSGQSGMWGQQYTPEEAIGIRGMEFEQRMKERKAQDKYDRKNARRERRRNRRPVSLMHVRRRKAARAARRKPRRQYWKGQAAVGGRNRMRMYTPEGVPKKYSRTGMTGGAPYFQSIFGTGYATPMTQAMQQGRYNAITAGMAGGGRGGRGGRGGGGRGGNWHWDRNAGGPIWAPNQR